MSDLLDRREVSAVELTEAVLARLTALEPRVPAFLPPTADGARRQAAAAGGFRVPSPGAG